MIRSLINKIGFYFAASSIFMVLMLLTFSVFYHYTEGLSWLDSFYFTVITTRTIGFGDISPQTIAGKIGTILNALLPATVFLGASLIVLQTIMKQLEEIWRHYQMNHNKNHNIIIGPVTTIKSIIQEYKISNQPYVLISKDPLDKFPIELQTYFDHSNFLYGDASQEATLEKAGIHNAHAIVIATNDDSYNLYTLVTAQALNPKVQKIVRSNNVENTKKFLSVGADTVLPAATILGQMLSQASMHPKSHDFLVALHTHTQEPFFEDLQVRESDAQKKAHELCQHPIAIYRNGTFLYNIQTESLKNGDTIIHIGLKHQ